MQHDPAPSSPPATSLDGFLAGVERRALRIAEVATRDRDEALDLVQDAMLQLARRYATREPAQWPPLFHRILVNRIRDWQRRRALRRRWMFWRDEPAGDDEPAEDPIERLADPAQVEASAALQQRQALQRLEAVLRRLPARQREAFELRVWEGLSVEDTATAMGCSQGSVKTHLSRAMQVLRTELAEVW